ncbi:MAG TPA: hypothetical protein VN345_19565 [Blastocatellia bacterium]|jgi:hypothetical protein|nr:hypothetical protein [Blastocatellia bacterium]
MRAQFGNSHLAERMACGQMAVAVVALLQSIQVKQQQGKHPPRAPRTFDFHIQQVKLAARGY